MNHYPKHVGDFIKDTVGLSLAERGAYTALLDQYYASERPIVYAERYRLAGAISKSDRAAVDYILGRYFTDGPDGWHQKRADLEIVRFREISAKAAASGVKSGEVRRQASVERTLNNRSAFVEPSPSIRSTNQEPLTNNHKPKDRAEEFPTPEVRLPKSLSQATWTAWKSHLAAKGKGCTPQQERLQLARLESHADPEAIVRKAIESGHRNLEPPGGWPDAKGRSKSDTRGAVMQEIWEGTTNERSDENPERVIDGKSERIA